MPFCGPLKAAYGPNPFLVDPCPRQSVRWAESPILMHHERCMALSVIGNFLCFLNRSREWLLAENRDATRHGIGNI
jgi:hypothetical protein